MTHTELVDRAARWLKNSLRCRVVLKESHAYTRYGEQPDAIGWRNGCALLVECKISRSDFLADRKKLCRDHYPGLGNWRCYLTPPGLVGISELRDGWSLYEVQGRAIRYKGGWRYNSNISPPFTSDKSSEISMLVSALAGKEKGEFPIAKLPSQQVDMPQDFAQVLNANFDELTKGDV